MRRRGFLMERDGSLPVVAPAPVARSVARRAAAERAIVARERVSRNQGVEMIPGRTLVVTLLLSKPLRSSAWPRS